MASSRPISPERVTRARHDRAVDRLGGAHELGDLPLAVGCLAHERANIRFEDVRDYLQFYLDGFLGAHLKLSGRKSATLNGPPLRPVVAEGGLFLPYGYTLLDGADGDALYRAAVAHAVAHLRYSPRRLPAKPLKPMAVAVVSLIEDARVEHLMMRQCPGLRALWGRLTHIDGAARHDLGFAGLMRRLGRALHHPDCRDDNFWVNKGVRLFRERLADANDYAAFRGIASILANDLGQMRVRFIPEQYVPEPAFRDDNSFLWDYGDSGDSAPPPPQQETLNLDAVRMEAADPPTGAGRQGEAAMAARIAHELPRYSYPEWDHKAALERDAWVTVIEPPVPAGAGRRHRAPVAPPQAHRNLFALIKGRQLDRAKRLTRQWDGEELDLNAAIAAEVDIRSGLPPDPRVFKRPGRRLLEPVVSILLDVSASTNDCPWGSFDSLLDIMKRATVDLGAAMDQAGQKFAIDAFCSDGRQAVSFYRVKQFEEPFGSAEQGRVWALPGHQSTRMGAALRHAHANLAERAFDQRILLLVTDGEPSDVDVKDPQYLVADAARAVRDLSAAGTVPFCVSVDPKAENYIRGIFGHNYLILDNPDDLAVQLSRAFVRLLAK